MIKMRVPTALMARMRTDLSREHPFAAERVGFLVTAASPGSDDVMVVLARDYWPAADDSYLRDDSVGARIGLAAIRVATSMALNGRSERLGVFHVHLHPHRGMPALSTTDQRELPLLVRGLGNVSVESLHGLLVLSEDEALCLCLAPGSDQLTAAEAVVGVGSPMTISLLDRPSQRPTGSRLSVRFGRQTFLGANSQRLFQHVRIGVVGLGGGGSHAFQQLAHLGFERLSGFDGDRVEETNLNRLVGATLEDAELGRKKVDVARRLVTSLGVEGDCVLFGGRWQERPELLRNCDIVVGCVDSFSERREIEATCRRYLVPYIDIGMDVHQAGSESPRMAGQIILSLPDGPCMFCVGFLTEERLAQEAARYGGAGDRPQVVWANGVLASTAVGHVVHLLTNWSGGSVPLYLSYDAGAGAVRPHPRLDFLTMTECPHYPVWQVGEPYFAKVRKA
jgi:hypothetical protein